MVTPASGITSTPNLNNNNSASPVIEATGQNIDKLQQAQSVYMGLSNIVSAATARANSALQRETSIQKHWMDMAKKENQVFTIA